LYINEPKIPCEYNGEKFPGLKIYCPKEISDRNLTSLVFKSGSVILVGGNNLDEYKEFFNWVLKIARKYPEL
jgi:TATA-box binding protein (TBP) (component of TFIID and TFIIIB)